MATLILGVIEAPDWGWGSAAAVATISGGIALFFLFIVHESRSDHPMLDVALFRNPRFTAASGSVAVSFFALQGFIFLVTQYFQFIKTFSPLGTGVRLLPVAGSVAVASVVGTKLAVRIGNKVVVTAGLVSFAVGLLWTATVSVSTSYSIIVLQMLFLGTGMGLTSAPATEAIMGAVPKAKSGVGSAMNDATRLFGGTLGVAIIGSVAASLYSNRLAATLAPACPPGPSLQRRALSAERSSPRTSSRNSASTTRRRGSPTRPRMRFSSACAVAAWSREGSPSQGQSWPPCCCRRGRNRPTSLRTERCRSVRSRCRRPSLSWPNGPPDRP